jgi:hypothetical protein
VRVAGWCDKVGTKLVQILSRRKQHSRELARLRLDEPRRARYDRTMEMNVTFSKGSLCLAIVALSSFASVHAQLVVSNLEAANNGGAGTVGQDKWAAQAFQTPGSASTLGSVGLKLAHDTLAQGFFTVTLWNAGGPGGTPGSAVATIGSGSVSALTTTFSDYFFTAPQGITLTPNTSYFVVLSATAPSSPAGLLWGVTQSENPGSSGPGQIGGWALSANQGATWGSEPPLYLDQTLGVNFPFQLAVTAVPEPEVYALIFALALGSFAAMRRLQPHAG